MSVHRDVTDLIGTAIKSPDLLWYEVHETDVENHVRLIGIDDRTDTTISFDDLRERMDGDWGKVYDSVTGVENPKLGWP